MVNLPPHQNQFRIPHTRGMNNDLHEQEEAEDPKKRARDFWATYLRLMGYAFRHKGKLAVLVLFSFVTAGSMPTLIVTAYSGIDLMYADEAELPGMITKYQERAASFAENIGKVTGESPDFDTRVETVIVDIREDKSKGLRLLAIFIIAVTMIGGFSRYIQEYFAGIISSDIVMQLRNDMFGNVIGLSHDFYEERTTGTIMARFTNDVMMVNTGITDVFIMFFREPIKVIFLLGVAFYISVTLSLGILVFLSPITLLFLITAKRVKKRVKFRLNKVASVATILMESVRGITVVKSFQMEEAERERMLEELKNLRYQMIRFSRIEAAIGPVTETFLICGAGILLILGDQIIRSQGLSPMELAALAGCMIGIVDPMRKIANMNNKIQVSAVSAERVFEFIDRKPSVVEKSDAVEIPEIRDRIVFNNVNFSYDGERPVLINLSFEIKKGEMVALVGFSGAGKSTIAKLLPRFYDPQSGSITIDGVDIKDASLASLRDQIGYVTQDNILFNRSIQDNIAYGQAEYDMDRVRKAAKVAHADEFIERIDKQYEAGVSEAGANLSGGQKQRIAIARAIMKDPAILILDEATSSLDTESETAIQQAIDEFVIGRTTVVIAHRLSTIQRADRIIVLSHGEVAEQGTHHELLRQSGIYSRLHSLQFAEMPDPDDNVA